MKWKDILVRALKTFLQGFLGALAISLPGAADYTNFEFLKSIAIGALAAGISAVMNMIVNLLNKGKEK